MEPESSRLEAVGAVQYREGEAREATEMLAREALLTIRVGAVVAARQLYLPGMEVELALGHLLTSGIIDRLEDVRASEFQPAAADGQAGGVVQVRLVREREEFPDYSAWLPEALLRHDPASGNRLAVTAPEGAESRVRIEPERLLALVAQLPGHQAIFRQTGGTHAILLADPVTGKMVLGAEDVGRHNAFDKVIGQALRQGVSMADKIALLSGRASYEMVLKAARAGIPLLAAVSAPTSLAVRLAAAQGITLVGFARPPRLTLYTHPERLVC